MSGWGDIPRRVYAADGSVGAPVWTWVSDPDTGRYWVSANKQADVAGGIAVAYYYVPQAGDVQLLVDPGGTGNSTYPALAIVDASNGFYKPGANQIDLVVGGTQWIWNATQSGPTGDAKSGFHAVNAATNVANILPMKLYPSMGFSALAQHMPSVVANNKDIQYWDGTTAGAEQMFALRGLNTKRFRALVTLDITDAETAVGLTPNAVILAAAIRVSTQVTGLDDAVHTISLGINGAATKYCTATNAGSATTISVNVKNNYTFDPSLDKETNALVLTIGGGADQTPSAGACEVEIIYLAGVDLADA